MEITDELSEKNTYKQETNAQQAHRELFQFSHQRECVCVHLCESVDHSRELQWNQPNLDYKNLSFFVSWLQYSIRET